ncbi:4-coumarate--CoA ligase [Nakamurella panacisegetis]|uniref:4-coumarate--CoA ligase n=1 Tax=Nakamurella panacisegetis TaxID=1090615 RepID=A0A1H0P835_9ACTN|nr:AMP-binding protein [Nakamurella panacisegetis]SDP00849.1 4-coumarate--CoA ligase [Nakamurella panacisegetis]
MSFSSPFPDVDIPDVLLFDYLFADIDDVADDPALIDGSTGTVTTYRQLVGQILALAGGLHARGLGVGEVSAILCPNIPAFVTVFHGIMRSGGTATTVNSLYTAHEISEQLLDSRATHLFTLSMFLPQADEAATAVGMPRENVILIDGSEQVHPDRTNLRSLLVTGAAPPELHLDPATHLAVLPYSSGTTGRAKGVMLTHRNLVANIAQGGPVIGVTRADRILAVLPFFHIYGMNVLMNGGLYRRAPIITMPKFDLVEFLRIIAELRATYLYIAPPIAVALAKHPIVDSYDTSSIRMIFSGAAPLDAELGHAVARRLGCTVRQGYGMSEMSPVSHTIPEDRDDIPLGTVGVTLPNMVCKIVDPATGEEIEQPSTGVSAPGELWCKGPNVMVGYLADPEATAATLDADGYLHTGDVATVTSEGYVSIVDRVKELIKYKGYQVPPAELEAVLLSHPKIADAAVIGMLDEEHEEIPKAFVVRQPGAELTAEDVMAYVAERVAPHKKVRQVEFIDAIPKSSSGKILRRQLRVPADT